MMIINHLLLTITAVSPALAAGDRALVGGDYCVWGPNVTCYTSGWPSCCQLPNHTSVCPEDPPPCEDIDIFTQPPYYYSTSTPTTTIATPPPTPPPFSWSEATAPPNTSPSIWEEPSSESGAGAPYCFVQDFDCYLEGVPECCKEDETSCDELIAPECDNVESTSTTDITETSSTVLLTTPTETGDGNSTISDGGDELSTTATDTEPTVAALDDSSIEENSVGPTYSPTPTPQSAAFMISSSTVGMMIATIVGVLMATIYVIDI